MQGDSAPEAFILEIQPFTPVFSRSEKYLPALAKVISGDIFDVRPIADQLSHQYRVIFC